MDCSRYHSVMCLISNVVSLYFQVNIEETVSARSSTWLVGKCYYSISNYLQKCLLISGILESHGSDYEDNRLVGCDAVYSGRHALTF